MNLVNIIRFYKYLNNIETGEIPNDVIITTDSNGNQTINEWNLPIHQPSMEELNSLEELAKAWVDSKKYIDLRKSEYPSIQEQLDMLYWDKVNGTNNWQDKITEIKEKYPKS